jgi:hypothetical protein
MGSEASAALDSKNKKCGVLIPTIHFYFPMEDVQNEKGDNGSSISTSRRSSAFHRILLYAVCRFHGLETSSFVKKRGGNNNLQGRRVQYDVEGSVKVVTVQGGVLLAPSVKLLDYLGPHDDFN